MRHLPDVFWIAESRCTGKARWYKTEIDLYNTLQPNDDYERVIKYDVHKKRIAELERENAGLMAELTLLKRSHALFTRLEECGAVEHSDQSSEEKEEIDEALAKLEGAGE